MAIEILGVDLESVSNLAIEIEEEIDLEVDLEVDISDNRVVSWMQSLRQRLEAVGLLDATVSRRDSVREDDIAAYYTRYYVRAKRTIPVIGGLTDSPKTGLLSLIKEAVDSANATEGFPSTKVLGSELGPVGKVTLTMDVPVEVSVPSGSDFQKWAMRMAPLVQESGLARGTGVLIAQEHTESTARFYLVLKQVWHEYDEGKSVNDLGYLRQLRQLARQVNEG